MPLIHEPSLFTLLILSAFGMLPSMSILSPLYPYLLWPVSSPSDASKTMPILTVATYLAPAAPAFSFLISLLVAPLIGSFLGVLIYRIPRSLPIGMARSRCDTCKTSLKPINLLPIFSYIFQRGRCARCSAPIGRFHVTVELAAVLVPSSLAVAAFYSPCITQTFFLGRLHSWVGASSLGLDRYSLSAPPRYLHTSTYSHWPSPLVARCGYCPDPYPDRPCRRCRLRMGSLHTARPGLPCHP